MDGNGDTEDPEAIFNLQRLDTDYKLTTNLELLLDYTQDVLALRVMMLSGIPSILPASEMTRIITGLDVGLQSRVLWPANPGRSPTKPHLGWCHVIFPNIAKVREAVGLLNGKPFGRSVLFASIAAAAMVSTAKRLVCYQKPNHELVQA